NRRDSLLVEERREPAERERDALDRAWEVREKVVELVALGERKRDVPGEVAERGDRRLNNAREGADPGADGLESRHGRRSEERGDGGERRREALGEGLLRLFHFRRAFGLFPRRGAGALGVRRLSV